MQKQKRIKIKSKNGIKTRIKKKGAHNVQCMYEVYIVIFNK